MSRETIKKIVALLYLGKQNKLEMTAREARRIAEDHLKKPCKPITFLEYYLSEIKDRALTGNFCYYVRWLLQDDISFLERLGYEVKELDEGEYQVIW